MTKKGGETKWIFSSYFGFDGKICDILLFLPKTETDEVLTRTMSFDKINVAKYSKFIS